MELIKADVTVVGGGIAGICAAIAAARQGLQVSLINDRPVLGKCEQRGQGSYQRVGLSRKQSILLCT